MAAFWTFDDLAPSGEYSNSGRPEIMAAKLAPEALAQAVKECAEFLAANSRLICPGVSRNSTQAGHDFWLTRNHHGSGFWDGDYWAEGTGEALTKAAHAAGERDIYEGDDGKLYF